MTVFLSHNSVDKPAVERIAERLDDAEYEVWLDAWNLIPGDSQQEALEKALEAATCVVVFLGPKLGSWQKEELRVALMDRVRGKSRVVPVLLPGAIKPGEREIPRFLGNLVWVTFKDIEDDEAFYRLTCGIEDKPPGRSKAGQPGQSAEPPPVFRNERLKIVVIELEEAERQWEEKSIAGEPTHAIKVTILNKKRELREGGQWNPGETLSRRYKLIDVIGKGGFAKVWKAWDKQKKRLVAVKMLHGQFGKDQTQKERFFRGARTMAELQHAGIVKVLDEKCDDEGFHYFVMAYWDGGNFHQAVTKGKVNTAEALKIIQTVGDALSHAHKRGLIHRDIKPQNILLDTKGRACLTDFDLVKADDSTGGTRTQAGMGTFIYAAPELMAEAKDAREAVDVYGLGMTALFALYSQKLPYDVVRDANGFINGLSCGRELKKVIAKAVAWRETERFPSMEAFLDTLNAAVRSKEKPKSGMVGTANPITGPFSTETQAGGFDPGERWVYIKPGEFIMGNDSEYDNEKPAHRVKISQGFWLGRFTVTKQEYGRFMEEGGYENRRLWSEEGWEWLQLKGKAFDRWYSKAKKKYEGQFGFTDPKWYRPGTKPNFWENSKFNGDFQPVIGTSWFEASAYCRWLSGSMRQTTGHDLSIALPTEAQWEWAARGNENRKYPWGSGAPTKERANFGRTIDKTLAINTYPKGETPEGLQDMAGNVWEWCRDHWSKVVYRERKGDIEDPFHERGDAAIRVLRGGAWRNVADYLRASFRFRYYVWNRNYDVGFRCCLSRSPEHG